MRNLKLTIAYDGTPYHGWQVQPGVPTVQGELVSALESVLGESVCLHGSGRTDAGVHALAQVASFRTDRGIELPVLGRAMNAHLAPEIRVTSVEEAPPQFHARYSARAKTYQYHLWRLPVVSPFSFRFVYRIGHPLQADRMRQAAEFLRGVHDFTSFAAADCESETRVREIFDCSLEETETEWVIRVRANGFLRHMVRTIVGTLIEVGRQRLDGPQIQTILAARDRRMAGPSAPARGLRLVSVDY